MTWPFRSIFDTRVPMLTYDRILRRVYQQTDALLWHRLHIRVALLVPAHSEYVARVMEEGDR